MDSHCTGTVDVMYVLHSSALLAEKRTKFEVGLQRVVDDIHGNAMGLLPRGYNVVVAVSLN